MRTVFLVKVMTNVVEVVVELNTKNHEQKRHI